MATANLNYQIASVDVVAPATVYPTAGGLSLGLQASRAGSAVLSPAAAWIQSFSQYTGGSGVGSAMPGVRNASGATGGQNAQVNAAMQSTRGVGAASGQGPAQAGPGGSPQAAGGFVANPVTWVVVLAVLIGTIIFFAHRTGKSEEFANIRGSAYNILYVSLIAIVGILMLKAIFSKFNVPGLSNAINAV